MLHDSQGDGTGGTGFFGVPVLLQENGLDAFSCAKPQPSALRYLPGCANSPPHSALAERGGYAAASVSLWQIFMIFLY
jgi:hypothetical protein